jgi:alkaline phosphatase
MRKILISVFFLLISVNTVFPQYTTLNAHSHNDYENISPFILAYENHFGSIEADIWAINGELYVAHNEKDILPARTLDSLYIRPAVRLFRQNGGMAWKDYSGTFQLLIDIKTPFEPALSLLVEKLKRYPDVFDPRNNKGAIRIVISGNRPEPSGFNSYPDFIYFDGLLDQNYSREQLKRIPLYSANFKSYSSWNGTGDIVDKEKIRIENVIDSVHSVKKKIRFWNAPDNSDVWSLFIEMGIDFINTDHIVRLSGFLNNH